METTRFVTNTNAGYYDIDNKQLSILKDIGNLANLISFHYESPLCSMGGMRAGKPQLNTYSDTAPNGMKERLDKFNDMQAGLMSGFFWKLAGKYCFSGTRIYLTHINEVNRLEEISKLIDSDIDKAYKLYEETDPKTIHYLTYRHICSDILEQIV